MSMNWNEIDAFLHSLGVEREGDHVPQPIAVTPLMTVLQQSHQHNAFYRIDLYEARLELLVLVSHDQVPLKFHFYRVQLSELHPLRGALTRLLNYRGSARFERSREVPEWHLVSALVESMKVLFWEGQETSQFAPEIDVQKIC